TRWTCVIQITQDIVTMGACVMTHLTREFLPGNCTVTKITFWQFSGHRIAISDTLSDIHCRTSGSNSGELPTQDEKSSVVAEIHFVPPGTARRAIDGLDIAKPPPDLGCRVGLPVRARRGHLVAWQGLRDAVGTGSRVLRVHVPGALALPQVVQAGPL